MILDFSKPRPVDEVPPDNDRPPSRWRRLDLSRWSWPLGFAAAATVIFLLYWYKGFLPGDVQAFLDDWLPLISVNEMLVWVMCALGLNIVVGYAGLLDLGFVAFWAIGGYTAGWLMSGFFHQIEGGIKAGGAPPSAAFPNGIHLNFWLVIIAAGAVCALIGMIIGAPTLRLRSDYLALVTLGFGEIIPQVFKNGENIGGFNLSNGTKGITPLDPVTFGSLRLGPFDLTYKYLIFVFLTAILVYMSLRLRQGRLGRAWLAIREDEVAASAMGVPLMRTKLASYGIGAVAGGIGGVAFATHVNGAFPDRFDFTISIILLAMVVLGGMGNVWGVLLGALVLAWINTTGLSKAGELANEVSGRDLNIPSYGYLLFGSILVLMMLFRREGFLPESRTRLVLREHGREGVSGEVTLDYEQLEPVSPAAPPPDESEERK